MKGDPRLRQWAAATLLTILFAMTVAAVWYWWPF